MRRLFADSGDTAELVRAQYTAFSKQVPIIYFILVTNTLAVCYSFYGVAPDYLSIFVPGVLCAICVARFIFWLFRDVEKVSDAQARRQIRHLHCVAGFLSVFFVAWALALYQYGDPYGQAQVAFYIGLTVVGCIVCLMQVRSAALLVAVIVNVPYVGFFLLRDSASLRAMAINLALVSVAMMVMLLVYARDFANLVQSRKTLMHKQAETQRLSDENLRLANLDSLTELPNRRRFFGALDEAFARAQDAGNSVSIGVIDLDGFKPVNDTYGHLVGDRLLVEAASRLQAFATAPVYRLGGDEFAVIYEGDASRDGLSMLGARLIDALRAPFVFDPLDVRIGCSVGFASFPNSASSAAQLYERADYALYYAKRYRRGEAVLFSAEHEDEIRAYSAIELALQRADLEAELSMVFQPIVDTETARPIALEALARWTNPTLGDVSPGAFIPVAERNGMIRVLTLILLRKALTSMKSWPEPVKLSFNLSALDISSPEGVLRIVDIIRRSGVDPRQIDFEITETAVTSDFEKALETIKALKALGSGVSLDDFGAGYSSLSHVRSLPLDKIKIDRSFIVDIANSKISHDIVKSLQALCDDIGIVCVAEGVEDAEQVAALASVGCKVAQGYYFSYPIPDTDVGDYLVATKWLRAGGSAGQSAA